MRTLALLLVLSTCGTAQPKLTPKDESDIRAAIREQARKDPARGPFVYAVRTIAPVTLDVAVAEADGVRTGTFFENRQYAFIMTRGDGLWAIARKIQICNGAAPVKVQPAQSKVTPKDESDIRAAIREQAAKDDERGKWEVWSERGPLIYNLRTIEPIAADVATAEVDATRTAMFPLNRQYTFIVTRTNGRWTIARKIPICNGAAPVKIQPLAGSPLVESPERGARDSSGCPD